MISGRNLYSLADLLDAEIVARNALKEPAELDRVVEISSDSDKGSRIVKPYHRLVFPAFIDSPYSQDSKRSSNLMRLANQAARGFGK